jgi:NAD(P)-dependent dehydrogenase (short-subunit alcohol dehydrogenase family)
MFSLSGKTALVTGASRGIGQGIALSLAKAGAAVAVNYHSNKEEAEKVVAEILQLGVKSFSVQADVSNKSDVIRMMAEVKSQFGQLNILVNNAGVVAMGPVENVGEDEWDKVLNTNLKGQFLCIQEAVKMMSTGGKIVCISSIASGGVGVGFGNIAHYAASKGGVVALVEDLAIELGQKGINVNAIGPGIIESDMTAGMLADEKTRAGFMARIPKGRIGRPEDIGAAAVFLSSDEADYITGVILYVDGGWLAK